MHGGFTGQYKGVSGDGGNRGKAEYYAAAAPPDQKALGEQAYRDCTSAGGSVRISQITTVAKPGSDIKASNNAMSGKPIK